MASSRAASPEQIALWRPGSSLRATSVRTKVNPEAAERNASFMRGGRRSHAWKRAMYAMLDLSVPEAEVLTMVATVAITKEIRAQELAIGGTTSDCGTLLHAAAIAGRVKAGIELLRCGADFRAINQYGETPMDLALKHNQVAFQNFLEPKKAKASTELEPRYAIDERNLVWAQRKRRKARRSAAAQLSTDEYRGAMLALDSQDLEEWAHLEGTYAAQGLCLDTIQAMKARRSIW